MESLINQLYTTFGVFEFIIIGVGVVSTTEVILGNDSSAPINGKVELFNHHPLPYTISEFENDRNATKGLV